MTTRLLPGIGDPIYELDAAAGPEVFPLPAGMAPGRQVTIRRVDGTGNAVTVQASNGEILNGAVNGSTTIAAGTTLIARSIDPGKWRTSGGTGPGSGGTALVPEVFTYNPDGTVATATVDGVTTSYTYTAGGNVATETRDGKTKTYTYDAAGNITGGTVA